MDKTKNDGLAEKPTKNPKPREENETGVSPPGTVDGVVRTPPPFAKLAGLLKLKAPSLNQLLRDAAARIEALEAELAEAK